MRNEQLLELSRFRPTLVADLSQSVIIWLSPVTTAAFTTMIHSPAFLVTLLSLWLGHSTARVLEYPGEIDPYPINDLYQELGEKVLDYQDRYQPEFYVSDISECHMFFLNTTHHNTTPHHHNTPPQHHTTPHHTTTTSYHTTTPQQIFRFENV